MTLMVGLGTNAAGRPCEGIEAVMRLAWATDIHLNLAAKEDPGQFLDSVQEQADALVISGDIAESPSIGQFLKEMELPLGKPIYFVLGNHDFHRGSIAATRLNVAKIASRRSSAFTSAPPMTPMRVAKICTRSTPGSSG